MNADTTIFHSYIFLSWQYEVIIHRLKKLASEKKDKNSDDIRTFLERFQTPVKHEGSQFTIEEVQRKYS